MLIFFLFTYLIGYSQIKQAEFENPPSSANVHTWWHWMSGNVTKEGITKDLESMKAEGINQATILNIGSLVPGLADIPSVEFNSKAWHEMFNYALREADRVGLTIGVHNCDGWSTSGGPWITPDLSMKQYVWSKTNVTGGKKVKIRLPQPPKVLDFYQDVYVLAYPDMRHPNSFQKAKPSITLNNKNVGEILYDGNPESRLYIEEGDIIELSFDSEFSTDQLNIFPHMTFMWGNIQMINATFQVSYSKDGESFTELKIEKFTGVNQMYNKDIPEVSARKFRIKCLEIEKSYLGYYLSELELIRSSEESNYLQKIDNLLSKSSSVKAESYEDYKISSRILESGIAEDLILDLTEFTDSEGELNWIAPKGRWTIMRFGYTTTGVTNQPSTNEGRGLECDKMNAQALEAHFDQFAGKLIKSSGEYLGSTFKFLLIDSWECQYQNWTKGFQDEFRERRGYSILNWIPVLSGEIVGNTYQSEAFLHDFRKTIAELIEVNYYEKFKELCHENQLEMHAEVIYGNNGNYPPLDIIRTNNYPDMPMTEFWANPNEDNFPEYKKHSRPIEDFSTLAPLANGKQVIGSEAYTGYAHYSESPFDLKAFGDHAYCSGVNQMILHSYVHQPLDKKPGMTLGQYAAHFNRHNPWWEYASDWMTYQSRIQYVLQKGEPVVDVIFFVGDQLPQYLNGSVMSQLPYGYRANLCNLDMLINKAKVINNELSFGGKQGFKVLALPERSSMEFSTLKRVGELIKAGVVVYGPKPTALLSLSDLKEHHEEFMALADEIWGEDTEPSNGHAYGAGMVFWNRPFKEVLDYLGISPDMMNSAHNQDDLMFIHKTLDDAEVYFVFNQLNKSVNALLTFRLENYEVEIWNPQTGKVEIPAQQFHENGQIKIPSGFDALEAVIYVFRKKGLHSESHKKTSFVGLPQAEFEVGSFKAKIEFTPVTEEEIEAAEISTLKSLTEFDNPQIKYFAGKAKYTIDFEVPKDFVVEDNLITLSIGDFNATAEIKLNGEFIANAWLPNSEVQINKLKKGKNRLEITVATVCRNRFIGDLIEYDSINSLWTTAPVSRVLNKDMPLKASGLLGPLIFYRYNLE